GTHRTTSAPRTPNPEIDEGESSAPQRSTVIRLRIPQRRSTRLTPPTPPTPITTTDEADDLVLQVTLRGRVEKNDDNQTNPDTRLEPRSHKESPEVEKIANISQHVNVIEEEEELAKDDYELKRREKRKHVEETRHTPSPTTIRSPRIQSTLVSSDTEKL
ncbi:hypothetical protein Tco_1225909, partial [Tanacetum coccineum]